MRTKLFLAVIAIFMIFWACEKSNNLDNANPETKDEPVDDFLAVYNDYQEIKNTIGVVPRKMSTKSLRLKNYSLKSDSATGTSDTLTTDSIPGGGGLIDSLQTCAQVTDTFDLNGNYLHIIDYGDGCLINGIYLQGKITYIVYANVSNNATKYIYEDFSMNGLILNGEILTEYYLTGDSTQNYIKTVEDISVTLLNGENVNIKGYTKGKWIFNGWSIFEAEYTFTSSFGYVTKYKVSDPLIYDYSCSLPKYVPVKGVEKIKYQKHQTLHFEIDYGDGECDYIATIKIGNQQYEIDLRDSATWPGANIPDSLYLGN